MEHKEYIRICDGAATAILFIHGIVGTPNHFNEFIPLIPDNFSVYNLLLDGHGKGVKDFSKTSMKQWEAQVSAAIEQLSSTHNEIYIVAHSLGTLLVLEQAARNPKISRLFLLAVPLKLSLKPRMFVNSAKVFFDRVKPDDEEAMAAQRCYGIRKDLNLFHYIGWIPRFFELFAKIRQMRNMVCRIDVPCSVYQSRNDELVSGKSIKLLTQNPRIAVNELQNSGHYYYDKADWDFLLEEFRKMIQLRGI